MTDRPHLKATIFALDDVYERVRGLVDELGTPHFRGDYTTGVAGSSAIWFEVADPARWLTDTVQLLAAFIGRWPDDLRLPSISIHTLTPGRIENFLADLSPDQADPVRAQVSRGRLADALLELPEYLQHLGRGWHSWADPFGWSSLPDWGREGRSGPDPHPSGDRSPLLPGGGPPAAAAEAEPADEA